MSHQLPNLRNRKLWAILPAAGSGSRFSKTELKQYQMIQHQTVLEHTVERINQLPLSGYVLAINSQDQFAKTLRFVNKEKLYFCEGGAERVNSVLNALKALSEFAHPDDWVFVHDAARPCVTEKCLIDLLNHAVTHQSSAILAIPVRDTLKRVKKNEFSIAETVDRSQLWQAQTPQISTIATLKHAIETALEQNVSVTDEASALEFVGERVDVVMGRSDNIKITYSDDLELARLILASQ